MKRLRWLLLVVAIGCATHSKPPSEIRFANYPAVTVVNDRMNVPKTPEVRVAYEKHHGFQSLVQRRVVRAMELPPRRRAQGVNAVDEVPDSMWFTNRGGLTPEQIRSGPVTAESPELYTPWTIERTKLGGVSPGFIFRDARGIKYLLKFEDPLFPELQSSADVIVDRLLWASGYNVPEDYVVYFHPDQLKIGKGAIVASRVSWAVKPLDNVELDKLLAKAARNPDGSIRATASRWIDGDNIGPPPAEGVRKDDPNDLIPHELRRDLRGMYAMYAWLDVADVWDGNFVDMWIEDPATRDRHYVKHYMVDFDNSMGGLGSRGHDSARGHEYRFDPKYTFTKFFTAGIKRYDWDYPPDNYVRGVATMFGVDRFDPANWRPNMVYIPFQTMDRFDAFWGTKIVASFTPEQIRAAVDAARFTDPRATEYVTNTLIARQRKLAAYWYNQVNPLDNFSTAASLCFDDLAVAQGYAGPGTRYEITARDLGGRVLGQIEQVTPADRGHVCGPIPGMSQSYDGYTIVEVTTVRPGFRRSTYVHLARDGAGVPHVIGIWRV